MTTRFARVMAAQARVRAERTWLDEHGGNLAGYVETYGSANDAEHYGDGAEAIYAADRAALAEAEAELARLRGDA